MKKFIAIVAMVVSVFTANAQSNSNSCQDVNTISVKPFVGFSGGKLQADDAQSSMRSGFTAGVEAQYQLTKTFALSAGVAYAQEGGVLKDCSVSTSDGIMKKGEMTVKMDYVNVPIMANFYVCKGLALKAGIQPGFAVNSKITTKVTGSNAKETTSISNNQVRKFDIAIPVGLSYEYSNFVVDARINVGAIKVFKDNSIFSNKNITNGVGQLTVGYRF